MRHPPSVQMEERIRPLNDQPVRTGAKYVLYWTQMNRRAASNPALLTSIETANSMDLPLLVYEGLGCTYPSANDRIHTFMLEAVPGTAADIRNLGAGYVFYLRKKKTDPNDILYKLGKDAAIILTDDYPTFIPAAHNRSVPSKLDVAFHAVDGSCIVPMSLLTKREFAAYTIRPKIHKLLPKYLQPWQLPKLKRSWTGKLPSFHIEIENSNIPALVKACDIDHSVAPSTAFHGGYKNARARLDSFFHHRLTRYADDRNHPSKHATSNLSPYLHFGHISSLEVALAAQDYGKQHKINVDAFLEELIVRRELGFNFTRHTPNYESLECLPNWVQETMQKHARDQREQTYTAEQMEAAQTYDDLWNASQKELLIRGKIHGYYRMYWGKKMIEWSASYEEALQLMIRMHDKYAVDGRDPNTYTSVLWCFGLHDRAWQERPIFGKLRFMSYEGMRRKTDSKSYLEEIGNLEAGGADPEHM